MNQRERALLFLEKAAEDEAVVSEWAGSPLISDTIFGFHCQQAVEKLLKATLIYAGIDFRRTHDLRELMDIMSDKGLPLPETLTDLDTLTPYAVEYRYEDVALEEEPMDRHSACEMIRKLRAWVEETLK